MFLSRFEFVIEHREGELNVFADILTRWMKSYRSNETQARNICSLSFMSGQIIPKLSDISLPQMNFIREVQQRKEARGEAKLGAKGVININSKIWIPVKNELKLKILVGSHCGTNGHRGVEATTSIIKESFTWVNLEKDMKTFISQCVHCITTRAGNMVPRPFSSALHGTKPNEVIQMDFLYKQKERSLSISCCFEKILVAMSGYGPQSQPQVNVLLMLSPCGYPRSVI